MLSPPSRMTRKASEPGRTATGRTVWTFSRPAQAISKIVQGIERLTAETAMDLLAALETSAEIWLQLDAGYRLRLAEERPETAAVRRAIVKRSKERAGAPTPRGRSASR